MENRWQMRMLTQLQQSNLVVPLKSLHWEEKHEGWCRGRRGCLPEEGPQVNAELGSQP